MNLTFSHLFGQHRGVQVGVDHSVTFPRHVLAWTVVPPVARFRFNVIAALELHFKQSWPCEHL